MRILVAISVFLLSSPLIWAQAPGLPRDLPPSPIDNALDRRIQQEALEKWALDGGTEKRKMAAREAEAAEEFYAKASQFVSLWEAFAAELNQKKTFNAKLAKQVAKAFHDLEKSDGWPVGRHK